MLNKLITLGLILGLLVGLGAAMTGNDMLAVIAREAAPFGKIFINAIKMVVIPLVVAVIFASIVRMGDPQTLGKIGGATLLFYWVTLIPAIIIGMSVMTFGLRFAPDLDMPDVAEVSVPKLQSLIDFIVSLIPANPFAAAAEGALLPLIIFTALFAAAAGTLETERRNRMISAAEDISDTLIKLVWWILWLAPLGVFGLIAPATARLGWNFIQSLGIFIVCVAIGLIILVVCLYIPLHLIVRKMGPARFFKSTLGAATIAFSTTSTAAAIPVSLEEAKKKLDVSESVADILIALGASMYRPGSALFQGAAIIFLAYVFDVPIAIGAAGAIIFSTFMVSLSVAPVPSSSVVTMTPALEAVGVPIAGLGLILGVDRIPDMMRSCVNLYGQIITSLIIDKVNR